MIYKLQLFGNQFHVHYQGDDIIALMIVSGMLKTVTYLTLLSVRGNIIEFCRHNAVTFCEVSTPVSYLGLVYEIFSLSRPCVTIKIVSFSYYV